jgi:hypothetical protein
VGLEGGGDELPQPGTKELNSSKKPKPQTRLTIVAAFLTSPEPSQSMRAILAGLAFSRFRALSKVVVP